MDPTRRPTYFITWQKLWGWTDHVKKKKNTQVFLSTVGGGPCVYVDLQYF